MLFSPVIIRVVKHDIEESGRIHQARNIYVFIEEYYHVPQLHLKPWNIILSIALWI